MSGAEEIAAAAAWEVASSAPEIEALETKLPRFAARLGGVRPEEPLQQQQQEAKLPESAAPLTAGGVRLRPVVPDPGSPAEVALLVTASSRTPKRKLKKPKIKKKRAPNRSASVGEVPRRSRRRKKRKKKQVRGNEIDDEHAQYALTYAMMTGMRAVVGGRHQRASAAALTLNDFARVEKTVFPPNGSSRGPVITPPHRLGHPFKFKDYAPQVFRGLRRRFNIDEADYLTSLCGDFNFIEFIANSKSGQFFFYSHDGRYMIKTQTKEESRFLRRILPDYYRYVMQHPDTLITRFYGMHRVKMHQIRRKMHFVIMASVYDTQLTVHRQFDLKGSTVGRSATPEERAGGGVLKDNDLEEMGVRVRLGPNKMKLLDQLTNDVQFLQEQRIMDYSLLLGIHDKQSQPNDKGIQQRSVRLAQAASPAMAVSLRLAAGAGASSSSKEDEEEPGPGPGPETNPPEDSPTMARAKSAPVRVVSTTAGRQRRGSRSRRGSAGRRGSLDGAVASESDFSSDASDDESYASSESEEDEFDSEEDEEDEYEESDDEDEGDLGAAGATLVLPNFAALQQGHRPFFNTEQGGIESRGQNGEVGDELYFLGIIDILQQYNASKWIENKWKSLFHDRRQISAVDPVWYAQRFLQFLDRNSE